MPSLGADMEVGTVIEWRVKPGDRVRRGDIVALVDTEKSEVEVEVFESGMIEELLISIGTEVPVGTVLARIGTGGPSAPIPSAPPGAAVTPALAVPTAVVDLLVPAPLSAAAVADRAVPEALVVVARQPLVTSPLVRHLAEQHDIDLTRVAGTGTGGAITRHDVENASRLAGGPLHRTNRPTSPRARRLATQLGVDLARIEHGSGPKGSIIGADVLARPRPDSKTPRPLQEVFASDLSPGRDPLRSADAATARTANMRRRTAALMARSKREIPHYFLSTEIDMSEAIGWVRDTNATRSVTERLLAAALLLRAVVIAALEVPETNGHWVDDEFRPASGVHLGVAVSMRGGGLIAPCIADAHTRSLDELMSALRDVVGRVRTGRLRSGDLVDPTITVTNLGDQGATAVFGVIYPPQVALAGFGKIVERPWAEHGLLGVRPIVVATVSADHRASDGQSGSRFLNRIDTHLQAPEKL